MKTILLSMLIGIVIKIFIDFEDFFLNLYMSSNMKSLSMFYECIRNAVLY